MSVKKRKSRAKLSSRRDEAAESSIEMQPNTERKRREKKQRSSENERPKTRKRVAPAKELELVEGGVTTRKKRRHRSRVLLVILAVLIAAGTALQLLLPGGLFEQTQNALCSLGGGGGLPVSLVGDSVERLHMRSSTAFVLTDSHMYAYNMSGKEILSVQHGYTKPVMNVSATRSLIYDRGNYKLRIDSLYKNITDTEFDREIITADLSDSGCTAVALTDDEYASVVTVYDRRFNACFKWSSSSDRITCVKLSPNGRKLCVVTADSASGAFVSNVFIFDIKSGSKVVSEQVAGEMLVTAFAGSRNVFLASPNKIVSFAFDGSGKKDYDIGSISYVSAEYGRSLLAVSNPSGGRGSHINVIGLDGEKKADFDLDEDFSSLCLGSDTVIAYSGNTASVYGFDGKKQRDISVGYGSTCVAPYGEGVVSTADMKLSYQK